MVIEQRVSAVYHRREYELFYDMSCTVPHVASIYVRMHAYRRDDECGFQHPEYPIWYSGECSLGIEKPVQSGKQLWHISNNATVIFFVFQANFILTTIGHVTILINNAGVIFPGALLKSKDKDIIKTFNTNTMAQFLVSFSSKHVQLYPVTVSCLDDI